MHQIQDLICQFIISVESSYQATISVTFRLQPYRDRHEMQWPCSSPEHHRYDPRMQLSLCVVFFIITETKQSNK